MNQPSDPQSRADFWLEQVKASEESGLSAAQFCKQQDLNYSQFMYWQSEMSETISSNIGGQVVRFCQSGTLIESVGVRFVGVFAKWHENSRY